MKPASSNVTIRQATADDTDVVAAVFKAAFSPLRTIYQPREEVANRQADRMKAGTRIVAEIEEQIVATVQYDIHKEHVHLIGLAVHPDFQRRGVARNLIEWVVQTTPFLGHNVVVLDTIKETGNVPVFKRLGFRVFRESVSSSFESSTFAQLHEVMMERVIA